MERVSIQEIAAILTAKSQLKKKEAERFGTTIFDVVKDGLATDRLVKIKGLGTFKVVDIESRASVNVNTGERVVIEGHGKITFTPDTAMKELVNKPFSQFETVVLNEGVEFDDMLAIQDVAGVDEQQQAETAPEPQDVQQTAPEPQDVQQTAPEPQDVQQTAPEPQDVQQAKPEPQETLPDIEPPLDQQAEGDAEEHLPDDQQQPTGQEPETLFISEPVNEEPDNEATVKIEPDNEEPIKIESVNEEPVNEEPDEDIKAKAMKLNAIKRHISRSRSRQNIRMALAILACLASFAAGYFLGYHQGKTDGQGDYRVQPFEIIDSTTDGGPQTPPAETKKGADAPAPQTKPSEPVETVPSPVSEPQKPAAEAPKSETREPAAPAAPKEATKAPATNAVADRYDQMDGRVRTGAYRIVGTDYELKAKAGDNTVRIAQRTLGPGMECYIEAFNALKGTTVLQEGQTVKIPKLELRKRKKKTTK